MDKRFHSRVGSFNSGDWLLATLIGFAALVLYQGVKVTPVKPGVPVVPTIAEPTVAATKPSFSILQARDMMLATAEKGDLFKVTNCRDYQSGKLRTGTYMAEVVGLGCLSASDPTISNLATMMFFKNDELQTGLVMVAKPGTPEFRVLSEELVLAWRKRIRGDNK